MHHVPPSFHFAALIVPVIGLALVSSGAQRETGADEQRWVFAPERAPGFAVTPGTPDARLEGDDAPSFGDASSGGGVVLDGATLDFVVPDADAARPDATPLGAFTVGAWVSIDVPTRWGGIVGRVQDDGGVERGWILGYDEARFTIGLSTEAIDDGDGVLRYATSERAAFELGRWHFVVATYDGDVVRLYLDGVEVARDDAHGGAIVPAEKTPFAIGSYRDANERHRHDGRLREVFLADGAMNAEAIAARFARDARLAALDPVVDTPIDWLVEPFLTWPTTTAMSVTFETTVPMRGAVEVWHESGSERRTVEVGAVGMLHQVRVDGLRPHEKYFYVARASDGRGEALESGRLSFRTAADRGNAFTFVAIGDTQSQADVVDRCAALAYMHRPNLVVHAGDLVSTGSNKRDWTGHFFPNMRPLIGRVPLMPVLGNHEQDAKHYYDYMDLPAPEKWYSFTFGDAEFFMIDGNRRLAEGSEQLRWLEGALAASSATWRFAVLHQPPYTSDSNDYGDTLEGTSTRGDLNVRNIVRLLEAHHVDICFSGHVHDYERTFPIRDGEVTSWEDGGVIYVTCAGGGGHLEDFDPANTPFGHKKNRAHHIVYCAVNGDHLEFQAIDEHGRLFDVMELRKGTGVRTRIGRGHAHDDGEPSAAPN